MTGGQWAILINSGIVVAILAEVWLKRGRRRRSLSSMMKNHENERAPKKKRLGYEAIDLDAVARTERENQFLADLTGSGNDRRDIDDNIEAHSERYSQSSSRWRRSYLGRWLNSRYIDDK